MDKIYLLDSTLREGAQSSGVAFSIADKLDIMHALDGFGIDYIEAGNPGSNPKDAEFFASAKSEKLLSSRLCAFGSTRKKGISAEDDEGVAALAMAGSPAVVIFGKSWDMHVFRVLGVSREENLAMISDTVAYFASRGTEVIFDAEHFFDGYLSDTAYALETVLAAERAGATTVCLCDTNGGRLTKEIYDITAAAVAALNVRVGIHCHNDMGLAVANAMAAVEAGARQVQGTFTGIGERCGNTDLATLLANLQLKCGYDCVPQESLRGLKMTARRISERVNTRLMPSAPYVGSSAFAHKGGMHIDAVEKEPSSFEHIDPELVGNYRKLLTSEMSGRATVLKKIQEIDPAAGKSSPETSRVIEQLKQLEYEGYQFEAAESSFELLVRKTLGVYTPFFELDHYRIIGEQPHSDTDNCASALIKVRVGGRTEVTAAEGDGPVHALDTALRKALSVFYPALNAVHLTDYKVRVMDSKDGTATKVRVLIESTDGERIWSTVGVSSDIIEASWIALSDSMEYKLTIDGQKT